MGNTVAGSFLRSTVPTKRKARTTDYGNELDSDEDKLSPKRRKITSTAKYIYKTLFQEGQGSDVTIFALNGVWKLHKVYLSQSPYFNSMFNGPWVETSQKEVTIVIEDGNITVEALHKVLGSLYQDEIHILPSDAVSILAAATLLQLDDIINQSLDVMKHCISLGSVIRYYDAAELYGFKEIKTLTFDWLCKNMILKVAPSPQHFVEISCDLMTELVSSPELVVVQTEFSLYLILKQWLFLKEHPDFNNKENLITRTDEYFKQLKGDVPYLLTPRGINFQKVFRALRLKHLIIHHVDLRFIEADNIIPVDWFMPMFKLQWRHMLQVEQGIDKGPKKVNVQDFTKDCVRCGRVLKTDTQHSWRWTGFNFGFDIVIFYSRGSFKLRRFLKNETDPHSLTSQELSNRSDKRHVMYRFSVFSLDSDGSVLSKKETDIETVSLNENEQVTLLSIYDMKFPVLVSANFLTTTPISFDDKEDSDSEM